MIQDGKICQLQEDGFSMEQDAKKNIDMQQCCILPSQDFIMNQCRTQEKRGLSDLTMMSLGEEQEDKRCNVGGQSMGSSANNQSG